MKIMSLLLLLIFSGCKTIEPQIIDAPKATYFLYATKYDVQVAYENRLRELGQIGSGNNIRGFYHMSEIHCQKWDFFCIGHEVIHHLQRRGEPRLIADENKHFE